MTSNSLVSVRAESSLLHAIDQRRLLDGVGRRCRIPHRSPRARTSLISTHTGQRPAIYRMSWLLNKNAKNTSLKQERERVHRPGERLTEKHRHGAILNEVEGHGIHSCWKGGDDSVMENPMALPDGAGAGHRRFYGAGRDAATRSRCFSPGFSQRGRLLALAAVASALQPQVRAALNHWEPELVDIVATTAGAARP